MTTLWPAKGTINNETPNHPRGSSLERSSNIERQSKSGRSSNSGGALLRRTWAPFPLLLR